MDAEAKVAHFEKSCLLVLVGIYEFTCSVAPLALYEDLSLRIKALSGS